MVVASARPSIPSSSKETWGTFETVRDRLFEQFDDTPFDPTTGVPLDALKQEVSDYLTANADQPKVLQKANVFRIVTSRGQICIDPTDWFADKLNHGGILRRLSEKWLDDAVTGPLSEHMKWLDKAYATGTTTGPIGGLDRGHISPGWENMLSHGLDGLLAKSSSSRAAHGENISTEQTAFYDAVDMVFAAAKALALRFSQHAAAMLTELGAEPAQPGDAARLRAVRDAFAQTPAGPPQGFHQALQFVWFMHELIEMEGENVRSMGQFDRTLFPFYHADLDAGVLTRDRARELVKFVWFKWYSRTKGVSNGKNFCFGGPYADGSEITNDLTYLALEAYEELNTPDPKLSVRFLPGTDDRLYRRVADLIRSGHNSFVLMNDDPAVQGLVDRGKTLEDARIYLPIGCYEPAVEGKEVGCTMNVTVNITKAVELALHDGLDPISGQQVGPRTGDPRQWNSFDTVWDAFTTQLDHILDQSLISIRAAETQWPQINPSPLVAGTIDECLPRGKDVGQGGALYNSVGFVGTGFANTCDGLLALKQAVFEDHRFEIGELIEALDADYENNERMRQYLLNRVPKWGNDEPASDELAGRIADYYCDRVHTFENARGGGCQAALFSLTFAAGGGKLTSALPDGRKAGMTLAPGVGSTSGMDRSGVTALINSVSSLDFTKTPNGSVLDVTLHPSAIQGEEGLEGFVALIKTFFQQGGYAIQFNVFDVDTLRDAQRNPEQYASLQIRVTGWSVYFTSLSKEEQDRFIERVTHAG